MVIALAIIVPIALIATMAIAKENQKALPRPEGPCDVYAKGKTPCVAAHSSTRALYAKYNGPLYQVMRQSDSKTLDIGVVKATAEDAGGYADAVAQDEFCANTYCWITILYDQSGKGNDLYQAPRGGFSGPAMGGFNNVPVADWAPVTLMGHKVYGIFIAPGMGLRWNDAKGTAVDDQAEGQYWVINGHHFNNGCCFDYGNAETDSRDDGDGTMETTYYGNGTGWYRGEGAGPWIMTDQENNLVGCVNESPNDKYCPDLPSIAWRFVTATADGEPHHWRSMGGDAQTGELIMMYDGQRIQNERSSYDPMRKQGAILLGNGGDNSNGSAGTFYEAAMTAPGTFPSVETNQAIQANIVAAKYDVQRLAITGADKTDAPNGLQTFALGSTESTSLTFVNTTGYEINDLSLSIQAPADWKTVVLGSTETVKKVGYAIAPGQTVVVTFSVSSSNKEFNGDLIAKASWTSPAGKAETEQAVEKVRNVNPVKINEFRISAGQNSTNSFIELYNASDKVVDLSSWTLTHHAVNIPYFSAITIPAGTQLAPKSFYLLGLSNSGLAVQAAKGDKTIYVRTLEGIKVGDEIEIGYGKNAEKRKVAQLITPVVAQPAANQNQFGGNRRQMGFGPTTIWQPLPEGPVITIPAGSTNIPVTSIAGFEVGKKMAIGYGATYPAVSNTTEKYEIVTITEVGKPGTQGWLSMDAKKGDKNIKVSSTENISVGDKIRLDIDSKGHGIETVTVAKVGTRSARNTFNGPLRADEDAGTGLELTAPLKYNHSSNMPFSVNGTGISFEPASKFDHSSNEPVLALIYAIELDQPLAQAHDIDEVVLDKNVTTAGYQGEVAANQLFGGPALSSSKGNMVLRNASGLIVDALNYGGVVDPWLSEGYHAESGSGKGGSFAQVPAAGRGGFGGGMFGQQPMTQVASPSFSSGRYPDGMDSDDNQLDFQVQRSLATLSAAPAGSTNLKMASVQGLTIGQRVFIGAGESMEPATIAIIGTPGNTALSANAEAGTTKILVSSAQNFTAGQSVILGEGVQSEKATVIAISASNRRMGGNRRAGMGAPNGGNFQMPSDTLTLSAPIKNAYVAGKKLTGTGVTLAAPLKKDHAEGESMLSNVPTPGMPNRF